LRQVKLRMAIETKYLIGRSDQTYNDAVEWSSNSKCNNSHRHEQTTCIRNNLSVAEINLSKFKGLVYKLME
jgi:hypothetical protein